MPEKTRKPDETVPGGAYVRGGRLDADGDHYGGQVVDAEGKVLAEFGDDEVNPGVAAVAAPPKPKAEAPPKPGDKPPVPPKPEGK